MTTDSRVELRINFWKFAANNMPCAYNIRKKVSEIMNNKKIFLNFLRREIVSIFIFGKILFDSY